MELGCQRGTAVSKPKFHVPSPLVRNLRRPHSVAFQSFFLPGSKYFSIWDGLKDSSILEIMIKYEDIRGRFSFQVYRIAILIIYI